MKRSTLLILGVAIVGCCASAYYWSKQGKPPTKVVTDRCEKVARLRSIVSATGEIRAKEFVDIQTDVAGVITEVAVREGESVTKGAILLRIDDLQLRAEVNAAAAQVRAAEADVKNAEVGVTTAEANLATERTSLLGVEVELEQARTSNQRADASYRRKSELFQNKLIGAEEFEIAEAEARLATQRLQWNDARVEQAKAQLRAVGLRVAAAQASREAALQHAAAAKASLSRAENLLEKTVLRAPLSGLITKLNVEKGERAVPGLQSNPIATLMTIADMSVIEAEIRVDEADIIMVKVGATAEVEVDALRGKKLRGEVTEVGQSPIQPLTDGNSGQNQDGKEFKVVVRLAEPPSELRPGLTATADIVSAVREQVLVLPLQALVEREVMVDERGQYTEPPMPQNDAEQPSVLSAEQRQRQKELEGVFVMRDGRARFVPVTTGITGDMDIEITSGLDEGSEVISGPYQVLRALKTWDQVAIDVERQKQRDARVRSQR